MLSTAKHVETSPPNFNQVRMLALMHVPQAIGQHYDLSQKKKGSYDLLASTDDKWKMFIEFRNTNYIY